MLSKKYIRTILVIAIIILIIVLITFIKKHNNFTIHDITHIYKTKIAVPNNNNTSVNLDSFQRVIVDDIDTNLQSNGYYLAMGVDKGKLWLSHIHRMGYVNNVYSTYDTFYTINRLDLYDVITPSENVYSFETTDVEYKYLYEDIYQSAKFILLPTDHLVKELKFHNYKILDCKNNLYNRAFVIQKNESIYLAIQNPRDEFDSKLDLFPLSLKDIPYTDCATSLIPDDYCKILSIENNGGAILYNWNRDTLLMLSGSKIEYIPLTQTLRNNLGLGNEFRLTEFVISSNCQYYYCVISNPSGPSNDPWRFFLVRFEVDNSNITNAKILGLLPLDKYYSVQSLVYDGKLLLLTWGFLENQHLLTVDLKQFSNK